jgi:coenzyme F420-reducing hydrogenase delta subunit
MCTGRIDPSMILEAFLHGVDGVLILGCREGECHYVTGNIEAANKIDMTSRLMKIIGIDSDRLYFGHLSSAEGARFVELAEGFTKRIREIGPLGREIKEDKEVLKFRLEAAKAAVESEKLRWVIGKKTEFMDQGNKYGERFTRHEIGRLLDGILMDEIAVKEIQLLLQERPLSVRDVSERIDLPPHRVLRYIAGLRRKGVVRLEGTDGVSPLYSLQG